MSNIVEYYTIIYMHDLIKFILQGILINGQFPGPTVNVITNDNVIVNVENKLDEHLLITW